MHGDLGRPHFIWGINPLRGVGAGKAPRARKGWKKARGVSKKVAWRWCPRRHRRRRFATGGTTFLLTPRAFLGVCCCCCVCKCFCSSVLYILHAVTFVATKVTACKIYKTEEQKHLQTQQQQQTPKKARGVSKKVVPPVANRRLRWRRGHHLHATFLLTPRAFFQPFRARGAFPAPTPLRGFIPQIK